MPNLFSLYNTRTRQKEEFQPLTQDHVRMYVCGPTVYDRAHIGNARPAIVFDVLYRLLKTLFPKVTYVRNITDVDDKINAAADARGVPIEKVTEETIGFYHEDMARLNVLPPDIEPRATTHIPHMVDMIVQLIQKGFAYEKGGHVFFRVSRFPTYGAFSKKEQGLKVGVRIAENDLKETAHDFVLWKPSKKGEPGWESPWSWGRPGWHIECSAMSLAYLGKIFDIHGGGVDLVFPHHENEIAQSCAANNTNIMARYWLHNGHLMVEGKKMSKSLGNFLTVEDLLQTHEGEEIRLAMLLTHYRQPLNWKKHTLLQAKNMMHQWRREAANAKSFENTALAKSVCNALCDDLNTPRAISEIQALKHFEEKISALRFLGFLKQEKEATLSAQEIQQQIDARNQARKEKNFALADMLRAQLKEKGIALEDTPQGTVWTQC